MPSPFDLRVLQLATCAWLCFLSVRLPAADPLETLLQATVRVHRGPTSGTAFFVTSHANDAPRSFLVSAAHVFADLGPSATVVLRAATDSGAHQRRDWRLDLRDGDKPRWVRHPDVDVAVLPVELPPDCDVRPLPLERVADSGWTAERKIRVGREVFVACYPATTEANAAGWPILRKGILATHPLTPLTAAKTVFVDYPNFGGDSGAPLAAVVDDQPLIVGVVVGMQRQTDKSITPFEERSIHTPLALGIAVQSPFVRDVIEKLPAQP